VDRNIHISMNPVLQECPSRFQGAPVLPEASKRIECYQGPRLTGQRSSGTEEPVGV
jgi:hypothetical protein